MNEDPNLRRYLDGIAHEVENLVDIVKLWRRVAIFFSIIAAVYAARWEVCSRNNTALTSELSTSKLAVSSLRGQLADAKVENVQLRLAIRRCVTVTNVITRMDFGNIRGGK